MCDLNICRVCLNKDVKGYKMDQFNLKHFYEHIMWATILPGDDLPQWLCYECAMMLHKFHKFKEKCFRGQLLLRQISWRGQLSYNAVELINRYSENLISPVALTSTTKHVKTCFVKHEVTKRVMEVEKVLLNVDQEFPKYEDTNTLDVKGSVVESASTTENKKSLPNHPKDSTENVLIKTENELPIVEIKAPIVDDVDLNDDIDNNDMEVDNNDDVMDNNDMGGDHNDDVMDNNDGLDNDDNVNNESSDDENIFLDIVKKAVNGENKLVFIDDTKMESKLESILKAPLKKKKNNAKTGKKVDNKPKKFARERKEIFSANHWKKYNLSEEEAMAEFKARATSEKYLSTNYKCHNCLKGFSKVDILMRHVKLRHEESLGSFECRFCHMRFKQKNRMTKHMRQHYVLYQCLRCEMRFNLESSAIFHDSWHNGVIRKCKQCGEEFKHSSTYYTHLRMAHRSAHICAVCGASFVSEAGLSQHKRLKHFDDDTTEAAKQQSDADSLYCEKCDMKFMSESAYNEHLTTSNMHADTTTEPELARRNMKGKKRLTDLFKKRKRVKPTTCINCGKHFATQSACMKHHLAEHPRRTFYPPDERHICEVCGASLAAVSISSHMNRHTREHVYPCDVCGMQFISKSSRYRHQVTHTGERPYPCPLCEKRFTQKNSMQLHYRTFHLKQPYPKRNRRKKTDEMPLIETCRSDSAEPPPLTRWRSSL